MQPRPGGTNKNQPLRSEPEGGGADAVQQEADSFYIPPSSPQPSKPHGSEQSDVVRQESALSEHLPSRTSKSEVYVVRKSCSVATNKYLQRLIIPLAPKRNDVDGIRPDRFSTNWRADTPSRDIPGGSRSDTARRHSRAVPGRRMRKKKAGHWPEESSRAVDSAGGQNTKPWVVPSEEQAQIHIHSPPPAAPATQPSAMPSILEAMQRCAFGQQSQIDLASPNPYQEQGRSRLWSPSLKVDPWARPLQRGLASATQPSSTPRAVQLPETSPPAVIPDEPWTIEVEAGVDLTWTSKQGTKESRSPSPVAPPRSSRRH